MKKLLMLALLILAGCAPLFAQKSDVEKRLLIRDLSLPTNPSQTPVIIAAERCACQNNVLQDGSFSNVSVMPGGSDITSSSRPWTKGQYTPQWSPGDGCCDRGFVSMWGNRTVGESIRQNGITITAGKTYNVRFCARFPNTTGPSNPFVRFRFSLLPANIVVSPTNLNITNTAWATYSFTFTASTSATGIDIGVENNNMQDDGAFVSWGQLDNVCIEETCNCDVFNSRPEINGPTTLKCDSAARFFISDCPGATITWTVTPAVPFTGQGTSVITLNPPFNAAEYRILVSIKCGNKSTTAGLIAKVERKECCNPAFTLGTQEVSATGYRVTGIPSVPTLGCRHYWILSQISNCSGSGTVGVTGWGLSYNASGYALPQPNPAITTAGPNNNGYTYPGLGKGQCYTLTHYVLCCGEWKYVRKCFCMNNQARLAQPASDEQSGTIEYKDLPQAVKDMHTKAQ